MSGTKTSVPDSPTMWQSLIGDGSWVNILYVVAFFTLIITTVRVFYVEFCGPAPGYEPIQGGSIQLVLRPLAEPTLVTTEVQRTKKGGKGKEERDIEEGSEQGPH